MCDIGLSHTPHIQTSQPHVVPSVAWCPPAGFCECKRALCNGHTVNTWLTPSLLGLQYQSIVDLRSYLQVQLNQLRINHECHIDAPVWTYALYKLSACYTLVHALQCLLQSE